MFFRITYLLIDFLLVKYKFFAYLLNFLFWFVGVDMGVQLVNKSWNLTVYAAQRKNIYHMYQDRYTISKGEVYALHVLCKLRLI